MIPDSKPDPNGGNVQQISLTKEQCEQFLNRAYEGVNCPLCGKRYHTPDWLEKHFQKIHGIDVAKLPSDPSKPLLLPESAEASQAAVQESPDKPQIETMEEWRKTLQFRAGVVRERCLDHISKHGTISPEEIEHYAMLQDWRNNRNAMAFKELPPAMDIEINGVPFRVIPSEDLNPSDDIGEELVVERVEGVIWVSVDAYPVVKVLASISPTDMKWQNQD